MCNCDENDTRRQTVTELIREDLQAAAATTYDDLIDATEKRAAEYAARLDDATTRIKVLVRDAARKRHLLADIALRLAGSGGLDHKRKNEIILDAVHSLLIASSAPAVDYGTDDIPF